MTSVLIPIQIIKSLRKAYRQPNRHIEKGGILLGMRKVGAIEVTTVTFPTTQDIGTPTRFHRSDKFHQKTAMDEWRNSGDTVDWIGDWHSHPNASPIPSQIDKDEWKRIVRHTRKDMIFLVVGRKSIFAALQKVLEHSPKKLTIIQKDTENILLQ